MQIKIKELHMMVCLRVKEAHSIPSKITIHANIEETRHFAKNLDDDLKQSGGRSVRSRP